jgi:hypothetical protein
VRSRGRRWRRGPEQQRLQDSDEEVAAALAEGYATDIGVVRMFECPVIPLPGKS